MFATNCRTGWGWLGSPSTRDRGSFGAAASLVLRAGRSVALGDGFSVGSGGRLPVEIAPSLLPDD